MYEANREFMVSYSQIRYEANREFMVSYSQIRYEANREFMVSYSQIRYEANREFMVSYSRISIFCKFICNHLILISMVFVGSMTRKEYQNP
jgi:hypothetical protein